MPSVASGPVTDFRTEANMVVWVRLMAASKRTPVGRRHQFSKLAVANDASHPALAPLPCIGQISPVKKECPPRVDRLDLDLIDPHLG